MAEEGEIAEGDDKTTGLLRLSGGVPNPFFF